MFFCVTEVHMKRFGPIMCLAWNVSRRREGARGYLVSEYLNVLHIGVETGCVFCGGPGRLCMAHRP